MPGLAALNTGGRAGVDSVSCPAGGICAAVGHYTGGSRNQQAFVVNESGGTWGSAEEVPGTQALNAGGSADAASVSCDAAADCAAGGYYTDGSGDRQAFVISKAGGSWGTAQEVPGTAALNAGGSAAIESVSCDAAGDCAAGGYYTDGSGDRQAFVVDESGGSWGTAQEVPGTAALNTGGVAAIESVSCSAPGACSAGGYYASGISDGIAVQQALIATESGGTWGTAEEAPGTAVLNAGGYAEIRSVSCVAAGTCAAGGDYTTAKPATQALVIEETGGIWHPAREVPGIGALNKHGLAQVNSLSCVTALDCGAGGTYQDASFAGQAFVVSASDGAWQNAQEVPGSGALNTGGSAAVQSVSCPAPGTCSAGGFYTDSSGHTQAFVADETGGSWGSAEEVPGTATLNAGSAAISSVSCAPASACGAGGSYTDSKYAGEAFVAGQS